MSEIQSSDLYTQRQVAWDHVLLDQLTGRDNRDSRGNEVVPSLSQSVTDWPCATVHVHCKKKHLWPHIHMQQKWKQGLHHEKIERRKMSVYDTTPQQYVNINNHICVMTIPATWNHAQKWVKLAKESNSIAERVALARPGLETGVRLTFTRLN